MKLEIGTKKIKRDKEELGILIPLKCHLYFFLHVDADIAEYFANSLKEWVTEGVDVDGIDTADALNLNQETLNAGYNGPDVQEGENGKVNAPDERHWDAKEGRQQTVKPVLRHSEGGEAGLPDAIETVCPFWFCNHIFKINLKGKSNRHELEIKEKREKSISTYARIYFCFYVQVLCECSKVSSSISIIWNLREMQRFGPHLDFVASLGVESRIISNMFSRCFFAL